MYRVVGIMTFYERIILITFSPQVVKDDTIVIIIDILVLRATEKPQPVLYTQILMTNA